MLLHNWYTKNTKWVICALGVSLCASTTSCISLNNSSNAGRTYQSSAFNKRAIEAGGLAVGLVVNAQGGSKLKSYERHQRADQVASHILQANPGLEGHLDSYAYVSRRMGDHFGPLVDGFKLEGELSARGLQKIKQAKLRRRFLMLVSISPLDEKIELPPGIAQVRGAANREVNDYEDVKFQTARLKAVRVLVYDANNARKVLDRVYSSNDGNRVLAAERTGRRYKGNSLMGALANGVSNRAQNSSDAQYPPAPSEAETLDYIWWRIAQSIPGALAP